MDKDYIRYLAVFSVLLCLCMAGLGYILVIGDRQVDKAGTWVTHTNKVIVESETLIAEVEGMLSNQRGYLLTGDDTFMAAYAAKKSSVERHIRTLYELTRDDPVQRRRIGDMQQQLASFASYLEQRAEKYKQTSMPREFMGDIGDVMKYKDDITERNNSVLQDEYSKLNLRIAGTEQRRQEYLMLLLTSGTGVAILLLIFNATMFHIQSRRISAERHLKESEERFVLALEGTNDGIFDWNLITSEVFYSRQFFGMLGYEQAARIGTMDDFKALMHPEDEQKVLLYIERYLHREISDYSISFRMRHQSGRWVWINSRAKAVFDRSGNATRIVGANTDITYIREYQEKLKAEKNFIDKASRAKSDFLAHMSHEIRTPLTAISGIAEIFMRRQNGLDDTQKQLIRTLHSSALNLKDLVNDILDFSKIESGELDLSMDYFPLDETFEQIESLMRLNAEEKKLSFVFDYKSLAGSEFYGDKMRIRQILINLISNAIKFTEEGAIVVTARQETVERGASVLSVDVKDTGIGIAPENHELIFERFRQADSTISRRFGGTGLGLPISRNLARLMGGLLTVKSDIGQGAVFTLQLPFKTRESAEDDLNKKLSDEIQASFKGEDRILIVDDYEGNIVVVSYILDEMGCLYDVARTGLQGLNQWKERHYDVVLIDIQMPEMDGFTATEAIRRIERERGLARTPIIGMTAHALVNDRDRGVQVGMDSFLAKPIVEVDLRIEILKYLSRKRNQKAS